MQRSETQLATKGLGSILSWQVMKGKNSNELHFSMASCLVETKHQYKKNTQINTIGGNWAVIT